VGHRLHPAPGARWSKIDLAAFKRVSADQINGVITPASLVYDPAAGMAYMGTADTIPSRVFQIRLSNLSTVKSLTLNTNESFINTAAIDPQNGFAYFAPYAQFVPNNPPGVVVKVRLSDLSRVGVLTFSRGDQAIATGVIDPVQVSLIMERIRIPDGSSRSAWPILPK